MSTSEKKNTNIILEQKEISCSPIITQTKNISLDDKLDKKYHIVKKNKLIISPNSAFEPWTLHKNIINNSNTTKLEYNFEKNQEVKVINNQNLEPAKKKNRL